MMEEDFSFKDIKKMSKAELVDELKVWRTEISAHLMEVAAKLDSYLPLGTPEEILETISHLQGVCEMQNREIEELSAAYDDLASDPLGIDHLDTKKKATPNTTH